MSVIGPTRDICVVDAEKYHDKAAGTGAPQRQFSVKNVILSHIPMSEDIVTEVLRVAEARTMSQHQPGMRTQHGNMIGYGAGVGRAGAARARFGRLALAISRQPKCECSVTIARLDAVQQPYNLFEREIEADVLPYAARAGLAILSYGALCRGLLSGRMTLGTKFDGNDLRKVDPKFQGKRYPQYLAAVDELKKLAHERFGKSVLALAVRWVLDQGPTIALWGARNPGQLDPISDVEGWHIDTATKHDIDAILKRCIVDPVSPAFMAPPAIRPKEQKRLAA